MVMPLLSVTVKRAKLFGGTQETIHPSQQNELNYVILKLGNVKSTTVTVKGFEPCWEQDYLFEINNFNGGLLLEVWTKGTVWDKALGYKFIKLYSIPQHFNHSVQWYQLDTDLILENGEVSGTKNPTDHLIMLDCKFEVPLEDEQLRLQCINTSADEINWHSIHQANILSSTQLQPSSTRQHQRQTQFISGHSGYSEDSDYTSDINYPIYNQNANCSASQYVQRKEKKIDDSLCVLDIPQQQYLDEPLSYNSQPSRLQRQQTSFIDDIGYSSVELAVRKQLNRDLFNFNTQEIRLINSSSIHLSIQEHSIKRLPDVPIKRKQLPLVPFNKTVVENIITNEKVKIDNYSDGFSVMDKFSDTNIYYNDKELNRTLEVLERNIFNEICEQDNINSVYTAESTFEKVDVSTIQLTDDGEIADIIEIPVKEINIDQKETSTDEIKNVEQTQCDSRLINHLNYYVTRGENEILQPRPASVIIQQQTMQSPFIYDSFNEEDEYNYCEDDEIVTNHFDNNQLIYNHLQFDDDEFERDIKKRNEILNDLIQDGDDDEEEELLSYYNYCNQNNNLNSTKASDSLQPEQNFQSITSNGTIQATSKFVDDLTSKFNIKFKSLFSSASGQPEHTVLSKSTYFEQAATTSEKLWSNSPSLIQHLPINNIDLNLQNKHDFEEFAIKTTVDNTYDKDVHLNFGTNDKEVIEKHNENDMHGDLDAIDENKVESPVYQPYISFHRGKLQRGETEEIMSTHHPPLCLMQTNNCIEEKDEEESIINDSKKYMGYNENIIHEFDNGNDYISFVHTTSKVDQITAKQRWHWAYNKIIIQLNRV